MKKIVILLVMIISFSFINTACSQDLNDPDENTQPKSEDNLSDDEDDPEKVVMENEAFQIYQPAPGAEVKETIVIKGLARVYEGTVQYEFEDGHFILDKGFTTATEGAPGWGEFEITIKLDKEVANESGSVILYEESAEDGSRINEIIIPVKVIQ